MLESSHGHRPDDLRQIETDDDDRHGVLNPSVIINERGNWELVVEARRGETAELTSCGDPIRLEVDAIYRDPLAG